MFKKWKILRILLTSEIWLVFAVWPCCHLALLLFDLAAVKPAAIRPCCQLFKLLFGPSVQIHPPALPTSLSPCLVYSPSHGLCHGLYHGLCHAFATALAFAKAFPLTFRVAFRMALPTASLLNPNTKPSWSNSINSMLF